MCFCCGGKIELVVNCILSGCVLWFNILVFEIMDDIFVYYELFGYVQVFINFEYVVFMNSDIFY